MPQLTRALSLCAQHASRAPGQDTNDRRGTSAARLHPPYRSLRNSTQAPAWHACARHSLRLYHERKQAETSRTHTARLPAQVRQRAYIALEQPRKERGGAAAIEKSRNTPPSITGSTTCTTFSDTLNMGLRLDSRYASNVLHTGAKRNKPVIPPLCLRGAA